MSCWLPEAGVCVIVVRAHAIIIANIGTIKAGFKKRVFMAGILGIYA